MSKKKTVIDNDTLEKIFNCFFFAIREISMLGNLADSAYEDKIKLLKKHFCKTRLEFHFDSAGPLGGAIIMIAPNGDHITVLQMEAAASPHFFSFGSTKMSGSLFYPVACIVRELINLTAAQTGHSVQSTDDRILSGAVCTMIFCDEGAEQYSCLVQIKTAGGPVEEIVELRSKLQCFG